MATLSSVLGNVAAVPTFTVNGRTFKPRRLTLSLLTELEQWLIDRARREFVSTLAELKRAKLLTTKKMRTEIRMFMKDVVNGAEYAFGSPAMSEALGLADGKPLTANPEDDSKPDGTPKISAAQIKLISLLLNCNEDEVLEVMATHGDQVTAYLQQLTAESLPAPK